MLISNNNNFNLITSESAKDFHKSEYLYNLNDNSLIDFTACVSCYNEEKYILNTLNEIIFALGQTKLSYEILVIDDCSQDRSVELICKFIEEHPNIRIVLRQNLVNLGLAQNYIDGAFIGTGKYYKLFCGDNTEPPQSIIQICNYIGRADIVVPIYLSVEGKNWQRLILSNAYTKLINFVSGNNISYYNGLHVHLRHNIMRWHPNTRGFGFQADILCMLLDQKKSYVEVKVPAINKAPSKALNYKNFLSVLHTFSDIFIRRISKFIY